MTSDHNSAIKTDMIGMAGIYPIFRKGNKEKTCLLKSCKVFFADATNLFSLLGE